MDREEAQLLNEKYDGVRSEAFEQDRARLAAGEPLAYLIGWQPFLGLKIFLDSKPLIPRPETEWWTERMIEQFAGAKDLSFSFLDLCAGSGAIGCAMLAHFPHAEVSFGELEVTHKETILKNIQENGLDESRAHVGIGDLFEPFIDQKFDLIAANPPYIPQNRVLPESVVDHEPHTALFAGEDGLSIIQRIAAELPDRLTPGGAAWIECDTAHAEEAVKLFQAGGLTAGLMHDQYGVPRVIGVSLPHGG